jgi:trigger factor
MSLVRKRYGSAVHAEVAEGAINEASDKLFAERGLRPAMQPKLEVTKPGEGSDLEFTVEMELLPDITIPGLADIVLKRPVAEVTDAAVDEALAKLAAPPPRASSSRLISSAGSTARHLPAAPRRMCR